MFPLILLLTEVEAVAQEKCYKKNTVGALGSGGGKIILTLLTEVKIFYVGLTTIHIK